jgi:hypothetical protein
MQPIARLFAASLVGMLLFPSHGEAQSPSTVPCPSAVGADSASAGRAPASADVVIVAAVTIQELRFDRQPHGAVKVLGCGPGQGLRVLERRNLPERVQTGVTYRDVFVSVELLGTLNAACIAAHAGDRAAARDGVPGTCVSLAGAARNPSPAPPP